MEKKRREGIVLNDPLHRVKPLKNTIMCINIHGIAEGMRYQYYEGMRIFFSSIVKLIEQRYEVRAE